MAEQPDVPEKVEPEPQRRPLSEEEREQVMDRERRKSLMKVFGRPKR